MLPQLQCRLTDQRFSLLSGTYPSIGYPGITASPPKPINWIHWLSKQHSASAALTNIEMITSLPLGDSNKSLQHRLPASYLKAVPDIVPAPYAYGLPLSVFLSIGQQNGYRLVETPSCYSVEPWPGFVIDQVRDRRVVVLLIARSPPS